MEKEDIARAEMGIKQPSLDHLPYPKHQNKTLKIVLIVVFLALFIGSLFIFNVFNSKKEAANKEVQVMQNRYNGNPDDILSTGIVEGKPKSSSSYGIIPDVSAADIINVTDLYGEITAYPAVTTILRSNSNGLIPITQYFTFKNFRNINVSNVGIAGRFNGDLQKARLYELIRYNVTELMGYSGVTTSTYPNGSVSKTLIPLNQIKTIESWILATGITSLNYNSKTYYYLYRNFTANEKKTFKLEYLPNINDISGKWDVAAFTGTPQNMQYSIILDPFFNYGSGSVWAGNFNGTSGSTRDDGQNLTLNFTNNNALPYNNLGSFYTNSQGQTNFNSQWNLTFALPYNYTTSNLNTTGTKYLLYMNETSTQDLADMGTNVNWTATNSPIHNSTACIIGNCITTPSANQFYERSVIDDNSIEMTDISFEFWVKSNDVLGRCKADIQGTCSIYDYEAAGALPRFRIFNDDNSGAGTGIFRILLSDGASNIINIQNKALYNLTNDNNWHLIYIQLGSGTDDVYIDGNLFFDGADTTQIQTMSAIKNRIANDASSAQNWNGSIDEFQVRTGASAYLTQGQLQADFKRESGKITIQTSFSQTNNTGYTGFKNFTLTQNLANITSSSKFVRADIFLETINQSITPYVQYMNISQFVIVTVNVPNFAGNYPIINSTDVLQRNSTNADLNTVWVGNDNIDVNLKYNITWFRNNISNVTLRNLAYVNGSLNVDVLKSGNLSKGTTWKAQIDLCNNSSNCVYANTTELLIINSAPSVPNNDFPINNLLTSNYSLAIGCSASTDLESDPINYEIYIDKNTNPPTTLLSNSSATGINYTLGLDGDYYWRCRANDNQSVSGFNSTRTFYLDRRLITSNNTIYNNNVFILSSQSFLFNLTYNKSTVSTVDANLIYNGTKYLLTKTDIPSESRILFNTTFSVGTLGSIDFNWNLSITQANGTIVYNTSFNGNQQVNNFFFGVCNQTINITTFNFTTKEEANRSILTNTNFRSVFVLFPSDTSTANNTFTFNFTNDADGHFDFCFYPNQVLRADAYIAYDTVNYPVRVYLLNKATVSNVSNLVDLYLLQNPLTDLTVRVLDNNLFVKTNVFVKLQRYYPEINQWLQVDMGKTDDIGQVLLRIIQNDIDYRFIFEENNLVIRTTNPMRIVCLQSPCQVEFAIGGDTGGVLSSFKDVNGLNYILTYDNTTKKVRLEWSDSTGITPTMRLLVENINGSLASNKGTVCDTSSTAASGIIYCDVSTYTDGTFYASAFRSASPEKLLDKVIFGIVDNIKQIIGSDKTGGFLAVLLIVVLAFIGMWSPVVAIILSITGLIASVLLGLIIFQGITIIALVIFAIMLIVQLRS